MTNLRSTMMRHLRLARVGILVLVAALPTALLAVTPVDGGSVGGTVVPVDTTAGDQLAPSRG